MIQPAQACECRGPTSLTIKAYKQLNNNNSSPSNQMKAVRYSARTAISMGSCCIIAMGVFSEAGSVGITAVGMWPWPTGVAACMGVATAAGAEAPGGRLC
eukprot:1156973-Pelagomonas_calceolata.AAC.9